MALTARTLLQRFGQSVTLTRTTVSAINGATGAHTSTTSTFTGYGAALDYMTNEIDGTRVQSGDLKLYLEATDTPPVIGDTCTIDAKLYRVLNVETLSPAGTPALYTLQLRR